ncbi:hypothetical protein ACTFIY_010970 [Dictyostelium cf. discoideum]
MMEINNNHENLFWKVFKNKLLFNKIFDVMVTIPIKYDDYTKIHSFNRIKFKYIISLKFMIEKNLYKLLKCKLHNKESIIVGEDSMISIFKKKENIEDEKKNEKLLLLILKNRETLKLDNSFDLIEKAIFESNGKILNLLLNYQNEISTKQQQKPLLIIKDSHIESIIRNSRVSMLKTLLNSSIFKNQQQQLEQFHQLVPSNELKNKIISITINNNYYHRNEELLKLILDNPILYNTSNITKSDGDINVSKIEINKFFEIESFEIKKRFFNLKFLESKFNFETFGKKANSILKEKIENILKIVNNNNKENSDDQDYSNEFKSLFKLYSLFSNDVYKQYILNYKEIIDDNDKYLEFVDINKKIETELLFSLNTFNLELLKKVIEKNEKQQKQQQQQQVFQEIFKKYVPNDIYR